MNPTRLALLIALVALVAPTLRYAVSFQAAEPALELYGVKLEISAVTGLAIALSYEGAAFLGLHEAMKARERGRKHWWWPAAGAGAQVLVGVLIVVPVLVAELRGLVLARLLGPALAWIWSAGVVAATPLSLATLALALAVQPQERAKRTRPAQRVRADAHQYGSGTQDRAQSEEDNEQAPYRICAACGFTAYSPQAYAGHCRGAKHKALTAAQRGE